MLQASGYNSGRNLETASKIPDFIFAVIPQAGCKTLVFGGWNQKIRRELVSFSFFFILPAAIFNENIAFAMLEDMPGFMKKRKP